MRLLFVYILLWLWLGEDNNNLALQLRRLWMQDHCQANICTNIEIKPDDYVLLWQMPNEKQLMLTFLNSTIARIPHLMFDTFPDLQVLRMENCSLDKLEKPQFEGASNLLELHLGQNLLREIPKGIFLGADNLNTLILKDNHLNILHNNSFDALKQLKELSLANNDIEYLPLGIFMPLRKLLIINLSGNKLETFHRGIFDKNMNLTHINLARNRFKIFESELFKLHQNIKTLDLSGNVLQELTLNFALLEHAIANDCDLRRVTVYGYVHELELHNNSLRELPHIPHAANVSSLDLSMNPLGALTGNPFRRFIGLKRLNLSTINIHDLPDGLFKKQQQLKLLDISGNSLFNLRFTLFENLKGLEYFYFQQNNWNCDFLQLMMNSFVKRRNLSFIEDTVAPELVDDYVDGIACWYEYVNGNNNNNNRERGKGKGSKCGNNMNADAALELAIVRNDIKSFTEVVEKKFVKVYRLLEEMKLRLP